MENMKSLADQIRQQLVKPENEPVKQDEREMQKTKLPSSKKKETPDILNAILSYDNSANKSMVHVRFDEKTVRTMNQFKMASGVDVTRLVSFSVKYLFDNFPELKTIIKQFIQNSDL